MRAFQNVTFDLTQTYILHSETVYKLDSLKFRAFKNRMRDRRNIKEIYLLISLATSTTK